MPCAVLLLHGYYYYPFISDDALISLRYAMRLLEGNGLSWNDGMPVEGYSNLAWVLLASALGKLGMDLIDAVRVLGFGCFAAVMYINYRLWRHDQGLSAGQLLASQLFLALCAPIAIWSVGGLEQPLVALCMVAAVFFVFRYTRTGHLADIVYASLGLAVLCITRPDGPLLCLALAIGLFWNKKFDIQASWRPVLLLALAPVVFVAGQLLFRLHYYGEWVPNTAYIKLTPSYNMAIDGLLYWFQGFVFMLPWSFLFVRQFFFRDKSLLRQPLVQLILPVVILWLVYLVAIGGDIFPGLRHFVVIIALLYLLMPQLIKSLKQSGWLDKRKVVMATVVFFILVQFASISSLTAKFERWEWHGQVLANVLTTAFSEEQPLLAVSAAGTLPYFTGFPAIDMLGLNDHYIARNPVGISSDEPTGHGHVNAPYVLGQKPDIVAFCMPNRRKGDKPCHYAEEQLYNKQAFRDNYTLIRVTGYKPYQYSNWLWFYRNSNKIGIEKTDQQWLIPGYFFAGDGQSRARLNPESKLSAVLTDETPLLVRDLDFELENEQSLQLLRVQIKAGGSVDYQLTKQDDGNFAIKLAVSESVDANEILVESVTVSW